ncbi:LysR family transcriptional regulator [Orrella sp. 11846]|uniref:LysR family transcriptional regulator n=1 Tax=Orrella sp. 11846 TaxID=3409913 RepID=UPI003B599A49
MNTRQMRSLLAIARHGTMVDAAQEMFLTPSALSQQMRALEQELNVELFDRSKRPPVLNAQGRLMVGAAQEMLDKYEEVRGLLHGEPLQGTLTIGAVRTSAMTLIPAAMAALRRAHPTLKIQLRMGVSEGLLTDVLAQRIDVAIVADRIAVGPTVVWRPFIQEPLVVIAPEGTPQESARELLTKYPYIRFSSNVPLAHTINAGLASMGIEPHEIAEVDMVWAIAESVRQGLGVAIVPHVVLRDPQNSKLTHVEFGEPPVYRQMGLLYHEHSVRHPLIMAFQAQLSKVSEPYGV